jgi:ABC-type nitrate/sulfonate/bicarbonate transport system substrate-binding protein
LEFHFVNNSGATTSLFIKEHPQTVEAIVKTIVEGNAYILNPANRMTVMGIFAKHLRTSQKEAAHDLVDPSSAVKVRTKRIRY